MQPSKLLLWIFLALGLIGTSYFYYSYNAPCSTCGNTTVVVQEQPENPEAPIQAPYKNTATVNKGETLFVEGNPTPELLKVLSARGIVATTPEAIMEETQSKWLGKTGDTKRRVEKIDTTLPSPEQLEMYQQVGMVEGLSPTEKQYTYGFVLGTVTQFMADAVNYLIYLWEKEGVRFDKLVFLTGERPLYTDYVMMDQVPKEILNPDEPQPSLRTEVEAAKFLAERMAAKFPEDFPRGENIIIVDAKAPVRQNRTNIQDTVLAFLDLHTTPGTYLAVTQQPFIGRQALVLTKVLVPAGFKGEVVGPTASNKMPNSFYLDSLARWIYEMVKR